MTWPGAARPGEARRGKARQGKARQGEVSFEGYGMTRPGTARLGQARRGGARQGEVFFLKGQSMRTIPLADIVLDFDLYPRAQVDATHVGYMVAAMEAGTELPPIIIDKASRRCADGFHRVKAHRRHLGDDGKIKVIEKTYRDEQELFLDAVRLNAAHGKTLSRFDRTKCILRAEALKIEPARVAGALHLTTAAVGELRHERVGKCTIEGTRKNGTPIPLKRTVKHFAGRVLTAGQVEANDRLSGMTATFYVNQVILLIENDMLDKDNAGLMERLEKLKKCLEGMFVTA